jgi:hypothetical protein
MPSARAPAQLRRSERPNSLRTGNFIRDKRNFRASRIDIVRFMRQQAVPEQGIFAHPQRIFACAQGIFSGEQVFVRRMRLFL